jgi:hypothetical protein
MRRAPVQTIDPGFDAFWAVYPRHASKLDAQKAWRQINPSPALLETMLAALAWQVTTPQWTRDGGSYVPYAATWLRGERWEDEPFDTRPQLGKLSSRMTALVASARSGEPES